MNLNDRLSMAIFNSDLAEVKYCLASGARVSENMLSVAIYTSRVDIISILLKHNTRLFKTSGSLLLQIALMEKRLQIARFLADNGVDISTALFDSALSVNLENVKLLVTSNGFHKLQSRNDAVLTLSLAFASTFGHLEIVKILLQNGVNPNIGMEGGVTALDLAKTDEIKKCLIRAGARENMCENIIITLKEFQRWCNANSYESKKVSDKIKWIRTTFYRKP